MLTEKEENIIYEFMQCNDPYIYDEYCYKCSYEEYDDNCYKTLYNDFQDVFYKLQKENKELIQNEANISRKMEENKIFTEEETKILDLFSRCDSYKDREYDCEKCPHSTVIDPSGACEYYLTQDVKDILFKHFQGNNICQKCGFDFNRDNTNDYIFCPKCGERRKNDKR